MHAEATATTTPTTPTALTRFAMPLPLCYAMLCQYTMSCCAITLCLPGGCVAGAVAAVRLWAGPIWRCRASTVNGGAQQPTEAGGDAVLKCGGARGQRLTADAAAPVFFRVNCKVRVEALPAMRGRC